MPSSIASGPKFRSVRGGGKWRIVPDFLINASFAAAQLTGANSGFVVFTVPLDVNGAVFLGATGVHSTAGTNTARVKKIVSGEVDAPGAAADADNVDLTAAQSLAATANTPYDLVPVTADAVNVLEPGDRVAIASAAGTASLAGAVWHLRFAWL